MGPGATEKDGGGGAGVDVCELADGTDLGADATAPPLVVAEPLDGGFDDEAAEDIDDVGGVALVADGLVGEGVGERPSVGVASVALAPAGL